MAKRKTTLTERQMRRLLDELFTNGQGKVAERLVLTGKDGKDMGGWGRNAVASLVATHLDMAFKPRKDVKRERV